MYGLAIKIKFFKRDCLPISFLTYFFCFIFYNQNGDNMKVKIFDLEDESDLEKAINNFIKENDDIEIVDIKYQVSSSIYSEEQIFCFSAMIIYY